MQHFFFLGGGASSHTVSQEIPTKNGCLLKDFFRFKNGPAVGMTLDVLMGCCQAAKAKAMLTSSEARRVRWFATRSEVMESFKQFPFVLDICVCV